MGLGSGGCRETVACMEWLGIGAMKPTYGYREGSAFFVWRHVRQSMAINDIPVI